MAEIDKRFALIDLQGVRRYPVIKRSRSTGEDGFALSRVGAGDRHGQAIYTKRLEEVIEKVVKQGWKVRASSEDGRMKGSIGLGKRGAFSYAISRTLMSVIEFAEQQPVEMLA